MSHASAGDVLPSRVQPYRDVFWFRRYFTRHIGTVLGALVVTYVVADVRGTALRLLGEITTAISVQPSAPVATTLHTRTGELVAWLRLNARTDRTALLLLVGALLVVGALAALCRDLIRQRVASAIKLSMRTDLLGALALEPASARRGRGAGATLMLYGTDVDTVGRHVGGTTEAMLEAVVQFCVYTWLVVGSVSAPWGLLLVGAYILLVGVGRAAASWATGRRQALAFADQDRAQRVAISTTTKVFDLFQELVLLGSERRIGQEITERWAKVDRASGRVLVWTSVGGVFSDTAQQLALPIILAAVATTGAGNVGSVLGVTLMLAQLAGPVNALLSYPDALRRVGPNLSKLREILDRPRAVAPPSEVAALAAARRAAEIRTTAVTVTFPGVTHSVLRDVSLEIAPGSRVAIVGLSGSGKTTLARVIVGDQPIDRGVVMIDGVDITGWPLEWRRQVIAFLPSPPGFLLDTIRANVTLGRDVIAEQYAEALRVAAADGIVQAQPAGHETVITSETTLSVGEQRRIALARALCSPQRVLLLDEPTAQLDPATTIRVSRHIMEFTAGRTCLFVTNDPELAAVCDRALLIEDGQVHSVPPDFARGWVSGHHSTNGRPSGAPASTAP